MCWPTPPDPGASPADHMVGHMDGQRGKNQKALENHFSQKWEGRGGSINNFSGPPGAEKSAGGKRG